MNTIVHHHQTRPVVYHTMPLLPFGPGTATTLPLPPGHLAEPHSQHCGCYV